MIEDGLLPIKIKSNLPKSRLGQFCELTPLSLVVKGSLSTDEWIDIGRLLNKASDSVHWWLGDWLIYGEKFFKDKYEKAIEKTGFKYATLRDDKYVASNLSVRTDKLTWKHHRLVAPLSEDQQKYWLNLAIEKGWSTRELKEAIKGAMYLTWLRYTDSWNFTKCDERYGLVYPGRIPGQIIQNVLYYYSDKDDLIVDPMAGGGTTLDVCQKCDATKRKCIAFDIKPSRKEILQADATKDWPLQQKADLVFLDPPYWSQLENDYQGMAKGTLEKYLEEMKCILERTFENLNKKGHLALLIAPMAIKTEFIDLPFLFNQICMDIGFRTIRRISVPVGTQQIGPNVVESCKNNKEMLAILRDLIIFKKL